MQSGNGDYVVRHGLLSISSQPQAPACPTFLAGRGTAPMSPVNAPGARGMHWLGEFVIPRSRLLARAGHDCGTRELMQFVRVPFAAEVDGGWIWAICLRSGKPGWAWRKAD